MKCIAIDDEPLALKQLELYAKSVPFIDLVKGCRSAKEALEVLTEEHIDLMLIDVNMPDINGVDFVKSLKNPPMVIFTTAHAQYALDGFKVDAVDYLVKPFTVADLMRACDKARTLLELRKLQPSDDATDELKGVPDAAKSSDFIFVKSDYKVLRVNINDILYIESMSEYVRIYLENSKKTIVTLISMNRLEDSLVKRGFMRVHRSYIVNLSKVNIVSKMRIVFDNDSFVPVGDMYKEQFLDFLDKHFVGKN